MSSKEYKTFSNNKIDIIALKWQYKTTHRDWIIEEGHHGRSYERVVMLFNHQTYKDIHDIFVIERVLYDVVTNLYNARAHIFVGFISSGKSPWQENSLDYLRHLWW